MTLQLKIDKALSQGKLAGAKKLLHKLYLNEDKAEWGVYETKQCHECNILDGEDVDCNTCFGVGTIEVLADFIPKDNSEKIDRYIKEAITPKVASKLKLMRVMKKQGLWNKFSKLIKNNSDFYDEWILATEIDITDPLLVLGAKQLRMSKEDLQDLFFATLEE